MKIIRFRKKGRVYELRDEISLKHKRDGVQIIGNGVRVFIREKNSRLKRELVIQLPDVTTRFRVNPDEREFIFFKKRKAREEACKLRFLNRQHK